MWGRFFTSFTSHCFLLSVKGRNLLKNHWKLLFRGRFLNKGRFFTLVNVDCFFIDDITTSNVFKYNIQI